MSDSVNSVLNALRPSMGDLHFASDVLLRLSRFRYFCSDVEIV